jgi:L-asparaginase
MAHFLIINTGGTIGMVPGEQGLEPRAGEIEAALADQPALQDWQQHQLSWQHWDPLLDSSDLQPKHWYELAATIRSHANLAGVLIIHGTDTLAYTASALSYLLSDLPMPVVITGSMLPVSAPGTDAIANLQLALIALIAAKPEVVVTLAGQVLPGSRVTKISTELDHSFAAPSWDAHYWHLPANSEPMSIRKDWRPAAIGVITLYPGIPMDGLLSMVDRFYRAIVINAFGNGNAANDRALQRILAKAMGKSIPVFVRSQCLNGVVSFRLYAAGAIFDQNGAVACGTMPFEAAITKLQILCSEFDNSEQVIAGFNQQLAREWQ